MINVKSQPWVPWLRQGRRSLFSAKIAQAEYRESLLSMLRRSLFSAKMAQAEDRESLLSMLRRSLFSAKVVLFFLMVILFF